MELRPSMCLQFFWPAKLMRIKWILWCICNYHDFTTLIYSKCCSICCRLTAIPMSSYAPPQFDPHVGRGLWWTQGAENGTNRSLVPTILFDFYTHYRPACLAPFGHYTQCGRQTDRQSDRNRSPMLEHRRPNKMQKLWRLAQQIICLAERICINSRAEIACRSQRASCGSDVELEGYFSLTCS